MLTWPNFGRCPIPAEITVRNITLRDIRVIEPRMSPGLIMANDTNPFIDVTFDNVIVEKPGMDPWGDDFYKCENVEGYVRRGTDPVPPCFMNAIDCDIEGGFYCAFGDKCVDGRVCEVCREGFYCDDGELEKKCPEGFSSEKGAKSVEECFEVETTTTQESIQTTTEPQTSSSVKFCSIMAVIFISIFK